MPAFEVQNPSSQDQQAVIWDPYITISAQGYCGTPHDLHIAIKQHYSILVAGVIMLHEQDTFCTIQAISMILRVLGVVGPPHRCHRFRSDEDVKYVVVQWCHQHPRNFFPGAGVLVGYLPKGSRRLFSWPVLLCFEQSPLSFTYTSLIYVFITCCLGTGKCHLYFVKSAIRDAKLGWMKLHSV